MTTAHFHPDGTLRFKRHTLRSAHGRGGVAMHKQEGDGATPRGLLPLRRVLYRADRIARPLATAPIEPIAPTDGWCDDPTDPRYNQPVPLPCAAGHEVLWRADPLYDLIGVLGWNDRPARRGAGSAIFLHVATTDYAPTEGCIALALPDLLMLLGDGLTGIEVL